MNKHLIIIAAIFLVLGFQNCSNSASFDADGTLVAKTDVSIQDEGSNTYDGVIDEVADQMPASPPTTTPPVVTNPPTTTPPVVTMPSPTPAPRNNDRDYADRDDDDKDDRDYDDKDDNDYDVDDDDAAQDYSKSTHVCTLVGDGNGNSVQLGKTTSGLTNDTSAVSDICMSEKACLETVSKAFAVKSADKRGYCKESNGSANFVKMSDKEVEDAIAKELLKRIMSSK